ncbi:hypothetical protein COP1_017776 [Malus domestica]
MIFYTNPSLGNFDYAENVFRFIKDPCLFVYDVMIKAFAKRSSFRSAVELFRRLREEGLCPYNFTYPFVLKPLDAWERFGKVFDEIPERDRLCWNVTISSGCSPHRLSSVGSIRARGMDSGTNLWTSIICELAWNGKTSKGIEFSKMVHIGMKPDDFTFIVVLTDCVHRGLVDEGCEFFSSKRKIYEIERGQQKSKYDANNLVPQENMNICKA